ncbi:MAG: hypothetical protein ACK2TV_12320 [Anaerolineales bacterium]
MRRLIDESRTEGLAKPEKIGIEPSNRKTGGYRVRVGVRAGDWQCNSCSGKTMGSQLFKAHCDYCQKE